VIAVAAVILVGVGLFLMRTKTGTAMRAVADNADLAESSGIDVNRVILGTWVMGATLAGLGGVLFGASEQVQWDMGFRLLLLVFAAVVLGGLGTMMGAVVGGLILGLAESFSSTFIGPTYPNAISFGLLVLILIFRPTGVLGKGEGR